MYCLSLFTVFYLSICLFRVCIFVYILFVYSMCLLSVCLFTVCLLFSVFVYSRYVWLQYLFTVCLFVYSLGSLHDGENNACSPNDRFIMSSSENTNNMAPEKRTNQWHFSTCSINYFREFLTNSIRSV